MLFDFSDLELKKMSKRKMKKKYKEGILILADIKIKVDKGIESGEINNNNSADRYLAVEGIKELEIFLERIKEIIDEKPKRN